MNYRKTVSLVLIAAFLQLMISCVSVRERTPEQLSQSKKARQVVRVMKTSGEMLEFDKDNVAYLLENEIRSFKRVVVDVKGSTLTREGKVYIIKTKSGMSYQGESCKQERDYYYILQRMSVIPLSEVSMVWTKESDTVGTVLVVLGGIAVTVGVVVLIIALTKESCPFLYAGNGREFNLEGELYSGAIFKAIERQDFLKLHSLKARPEGYLLKIASESRETQYTDELTLLAVDHPRESDVYAGADGLIHTVEAPVMAVRAQDFEGKDFTPMLSAPDGRMWCSNPVGKDPENPAHWRSGLTLYFPKPPAVKTAKLVVRIGNTYWADYAFGQFLSLMGAMMPFWSQKNEQDPAIRKKAGKFMSDHGLGLKVQVQDKEGWRDTGFFYPTGPFGIKDDVLLLPLEGTLEGSLTVRLQGGTFFWMIDYAAVDYSPDRHLDVQALSPYEALDNSGNDIRASLLRPDGDYFIMPEPGNCALVKYPALPLKSGLTRSFLLRSAGYYTIHAQEVGPPDLPKLLAFKQNPDLFLKFSLQEIQKKVLAAVNSKSAPAQIPDR